MGPLQVAVCRPPQLGLLLFTSMHGRTMAVLVLFGQEHMSPVALSSIAGRLTPVVLSVPQLPTRQVRPAQDTLAAVPVRRAWQIVFASVPVQVTPLGLLLPKIVTVE